MHALHSRQPWIRTKCLTPPARNRGEPWPECAACSRWPSRAVLATMKAMTSSEVDVCRALQPDLVQLHQRVGSQVSDRAGTLPEIGTPHPVPRSGCTAKLSEGSAGVGFPTCTEPVALAWSIGVGGFGTAFRLETLGERWLSTGAMVPRSSGMATTTRCLGRIWAKCGRGTGSGTPGPGATSCSLAVSGMSAQADKPRTSRPQIGKTDAPRARMLDFQQRSTHG